MEHFKLSAGYNFTIEQLPVGLHVAVSDAKGQVVCHKVQNKQLQLFLGDDAPVLFKGRLQLRKHKDRITIWVKDQPVGEMTTGDLDRLMQNARIVFNVSAASEALST